MQVGPHGVPDHCKRQKRLLWELKERAWTIYALRDPRTRAVRYVGITCNPKQRLYAHLRARYSAGIAAWQDELALLGQKPVLTTLAKFHGPWAAAYEVELAWIRKCLARGDRLLNHQWHR